MRKYLVMAMMTAAVSACVNGPFGKAPEGSAESKSQHMLAIGIDDYEDGKYPEAGREIQGALDLGLGKADQVKAHKYLAFIECISGKERLCHDEFRKALDIDPGMDLTPAEAGHPIWGPVFRGVKGSKPDARK